MSSFIIELLLWAAKPRSTSSNLYLHEIEKLLQNPMLNRHLIFELANFAETKVQCLNFRLLRFKNYRLVNLLSRNLVTNSIDTVDYCRYFFPSKPHLSLVTFICYLAYCLICKFHCGRNLKDLGLKGMLAPELGKLLHLRTL